MSVAYVAVYMHVQGLCREGDENLDVGSCAVHFGAGGQIQIGDQVGQRVRLHHRHHSHRLVCRFGCQRLIDRVDVPAHQRMLHTNIPIHIPIVAVTGSCSMMLMDRWSLHQAIYTSSSIRIA